MFCASHQPKSLCVGRERENMRTLSSQSLVTHKNYIIHYTIYSLIYVDHLANTNMCSRPHIYIHLNLAMNLTQVKLCIGIYVYTKRTMYLYNMCV